MSFTGYSQNVGTIYDLSKRHDEGWKQGERKGRGIALMFFKNKLLNAASRLLLLKSDSVLSRIDFRLEEVGVLS